MYYGIPYGILIPALLLAGALLVLSIFNFLLYLNHKERIVLRYCLYLVTIGLYVVANLFSNSTWAAELPFKLYPLSHAMNYIVILAYAGFLMEVARSVRQNFRQLFFCWAVLVKLTIGYIIFNVVSAFVNFSGEQWLNWLLGNIFRFLYLAQGVWAVILLFPAIKGRFASMIKWGGGIYLFFMIIVQLTVMFSRNLTFLGLNFMHWVYLGTFVEIVIFSFAISYKVREAFQQVLDVRTQMSRDLHDDIGASLSSLRIYSEIARQSITSNAAKSIEMMDKIAKQSTHLMDTMGDMVWSMKTGQDQPVPLIVRIKNYASELLDDKDIEVMYDIQPDIDDYLQQMPARKNILLIIKEALNNLAKYSRANKAGISVHIKAQQLIVEVTDNGIGFTPVQFANGNGLLNMEQRAKELGGQFSITQPPGGGVRITVHIPLLAIY
jgi:signal transduction histidine kinase